jgi:hypothetical protein
MSFVTETELQEIKAKRGGLLRPEDGTMEVEKTLWAVLQEVGMNGLDDGRSLLCIVCFWGGRGRGGGGGGLGEGEEIFSLGGSPRARSHSHDDTQSHWVPCP